MSRFNAFLHRTGERLALPAATRTLILVEIAADLDDLFLHYLAQGLSEPEAAARAEEMVDMSDQALEELIRIHSDTRCWPERLVRRPQPFWERLAMGLIVLFCAGAASVEVNWRPLAHMTPSMWVSLGIFATLVVFLLVQLLRSEGRINPRRWRDGLAVPAFLGAASLVVALAGVGIDVYRTHMAMAFEPERAAALFSGVLLRGTSTIAIGLVVALCCAIGWFVLAGRLARFEDAAAQPRTEVT